MNTMNLGELLKFCKDFEVELTKQDVTDLYRKKSLRTNNPLFYDTFKEILEDMFRLIIHQKIQQCKEGITSIEKTFENEQHS